MPSSRKNVEALTDALGMINIAIPLISKLGFTIYDGIKAAHEGGDETTPAEALAELAKFEQITTTVKTDIHEWQATHPLVPE